MDPELQAARAAWAQVREVEAVTVTVIVDNETDGLSTPCDCCDPSLEPPTSTPYQSEFTNAVQNVMNGKWPCFDFRQSLMAGHGLSLMVAATTADGAVRRVLFDGGPRPELWASNAARLEVDPAGLGAAVLSHWHVDHSCGLVAVAKAVSEARGQAAAEAEAGSRPEPHAAADVAPFVFDLHPDRPMRRGLMLSDKAGKPTPAIPFNEDPKWDDFALPGCRVDRRADPHTLLDDCFFVSGSIPRLTSFETGQPGHATQGADGVWRPDPHIMDERYLAVRVRGQGAVVFSSCSHAGIVNVVSHLRQVSQGPVFGVLGGFHLASRFMEGRIPETVQGLKALEPRLVVGGHCTGWRAKAALIAAFPGRFQPCSVGGTYSFLAPARENAGETIAASSHRPGGTGEQD